MSKTWRKIRYGKEGFVKGHFYREDIGDDQYDTYIALASTPTHKTGQLYWRELATRTRLYPTASFELYIGHGKAPKGWKIENQGAGNV